jgi:hypothetical protein
MSLIWKAETIPVQFPKIFLVSFLASFAAFFSLGDIAGFFLVSRLFLCSLLMLLTPGKQWGISSNSAFCQSRLCLAEIICDY